MKLDELINFFKKDKGSTKKMEAARTFSNYKKGIDNTNSNYVFYDLYKEKVFSSSMYGRGLNNQHNRIARGRRGLESREEFDIYTALYGGKHFYKLLSACKTSKINFRSNKIEIIDYACGQGYATFIFLENLAKENRLSEIKEIQIRFIDISPIVIDVAIDQIKILKEHYSCFKKIKIKIIKKAMDINSIESYQLRNSDQNSSKIHLFSNILDIIGINKEAIARHIISNYSGYNYFICVSPSYPSAETGMDKFSNVFLRSYNNEYNEVRSIDRNSNVLLEGKEYNFYQGRWIKGIIKRAEKQFYINNL